MRLPGLPRLPVSRRRHEDGRNNIRSISTRASKRWWREHAEVLWANSVHFMRERDEAREQRDHLAQRVADLLEERPKASERRDELMAERDDARLRGVRVERERDEFLAALRTRGQQLDKALARVAELESAVRGHLTTNAGHARLRAVLDGQERGDEPITHQDGRRYRLVQDGERSFRAVPDLPPAEPDPELIGYMEQPNPGPRWRRERGYESSTQPPTGKPPSDPPKGHGSDMTKTSAEVDPPSESGASRVHEPEPCRGLRWGYHDPRTCSRRNCPHPDPEEYEGGRR